MAEKTPSLQDVIRRRQQANFVGRDAHLSLFRENLSLPDTDERKRFIFNVHGDGGVGKTYLLQQLRRVAREHDATEAYVDEHVYGVPETMALLATQLGEPMAEFKKRYALYEKRREEVARDPQAPVAAWSRLTRTTVKIGLHASKAIPGAGPIVDLVDADSAADAADQVRIYLTRRFTDSKDLQLLLNPVEELTRAFVAGLRLATEHNALCLFFDTYERTSPALDGWLLDMFAGRFGSMPAAITWTIAGREPLGSNRWIDYLGITAAIPLRPFSRTEARQLLSARGITDEGTIATILRLSGGLPLLVAMLAEHQPRTADDIDDPTGTAVERFLKWEDDPGRRTIALLCALPRAVDADIMGVLAPKVDCPTMLEWLCRLPFVSSRAERFEYHPVVRAPMIRMRRRQTPRGWRTAHLDLAENHRKSRAALQSESDWSNPQWLHHRLEEMYHRLCVDAPGAESEALTLTVSAAVEGSATARRWLDMVRDAGTDSENERMVGIAERLLATLRDQRAECVELLTELLNAGVLDREAQVDALVERGGLNYYADKEELAIADLTAAIELDGGRSQAYALRGAAHHWVGQYEAALADFGRAIDLNPENPWALAARGETYRCIDRYEDALEDLNRAIELKPSEEWTLSTRGAVYFASERYKEALADCNRAIELEPEGVVALSCRGAVLHKMERYEDALADLNRAVELEPEYIFALATRAVVLQKMERHEDALADLDRAIELDPERKGLLSARAATYRAMERYEEALADYDRAIELDPGNPWPAINRARVYHTMERYEEALADCNRAFELNPNSPEILAYRGRVHLTTKHYQAALTDADRAAELDPTHKWAHCVRGETYWAMERYEEAIAAFNRATELDPNFEFARVCRGQVLEKMKRHEEAIADFSWLIERNPSDRWLLYLRGETYHAMNRYQDALADLNHAIEIDPTYTLALTERGQLYLNANRYQDALADWNRLIEIGRDSLYTILDRAMTYRLMKRYEEAITDLNRALEMEPKNTSIVAFRALVHGDLRRYEEAFSGLRRAAELDPEAAVVFGIRGEIYLMMGRHEEALVELNRCLELDPDEEEGYEFRAKAFLAMGRFDEALTDVSQAIKLSPTDSELYGLRSAVYAALGRHEESAADLDVRRRLVAMYEALPAPR